MSENHQNTTSDEIVIDRTLPMLALDGAIITDAVKRHTDAQSPAPMRMAAARAMAPMGPKDLVVTLYQLLMDPEPKIAASAKATFLKLEERILNAVLGESLPAQLLSALARVVVDRPKELEKLLLNRASPDEAYAYVAKYATTSEVISIICNNQERLLRNHEIVRALSKNTKVLRSDLDRAVDFLVREGVFLEDVQAFEDSFMRLGKAEMVEVVKKIEMPATLLTREQQKMAQELGVTHEELLLGTDDVLNKLNEKQEKEGASAEVVVDPDAEDPAVPQGQQPANGRRQALAKYPVPVQIKLALTGDHSAAIEALQSTNRMVAGAGIRNPRIRESDVVRISRMKTMHEDVIRYICNNNDWTKSYAVKFNLLQNPKTPPILISRWIPLLRVSDLRSLSKSKQVPNAVQVQARRLILTKEGGGKA